MHFIPGLQLRASEEAEMLGIDDAEMGEFAYDYVALDAELGLAQHPHGVHEIPNELDGTPPKERRGGHAGPEDIAAVHGHGHGHGHDHPRVVEKELSTHGSSTEKA